MASRSATAPSARADPEPVSFAVAAAPAEDGKVVVVVVAGDTARDVVEDVALAADGVGGTAGAGDVGVAGAAGADAVELRVTVGAVVGTLSARITDSARLAHTSPASGPTCCHRSPSTFTVVAEYDVVLVGCCDARR